MKRTLSIIAALVLALGLTQCKKAETPQASTGDPIHVTFTATYGGERTTFTPADGSFTWSTGVTEYIYVGGSAHEGCIGTLSATGNGGSTLIFTGDLYNNITLQPNEMLYFFYLGNGQHTGATTVDFSTQTGDFADLTNYHIAVGSQKYNGSDNFSAYLEPLVAFAYFDLSGFAGETVYMHGDGVYATATIDYQTGTIEKGTKGYINIGTASSSKYVALIPSTSVSSIDYATTVKFSSISYTGSLEFKRGIFAGRYYTANNATALGVSAIKEDGTVSGLFSVEGTNGITTKMVRFSKGNLQYQANSTNATEPPYTPKWRFAENQWDYVGTQTPFSGNSGGTVSGSDNHDISFSYSGWIDLFGWGTSGYEHGAIAYQPWSTSIEYSDYYAYGDYIYNLYDQTGKADWGYNAISYGGNPVNSGWRTLTTDEWEWLLGPFDSPNPGTNCRPSATSLRGWKIVNGVNGLVILPDGCNLSINGSNWDDLAAAGAVFLPAAGHRRETNVYEVGTYGYYWSASPSAIDKSLARRLDFSENDVKPSNGGHRNRGYCVRLVR